jgi:ubiquinone/menaquinone biosynthesis C-methylase UbiE
LAAARRRAKVTGIDITPVLLERARARAEAEDLRVHFEHGDATALTFEDGSFDIVVSTFGSIFAPDPERVAAEMARVCRPGGKMGMAVWTPEGMLGKLFRMLARYSPPGAQVDLPVSWGDKTVLKQRLAPYISDMEIKHQAVRFRAPSPSHWVEFMKTYFGPAILALEHSNQYARQKLTLEMLELIGEYNRSPNSTVLAESEYLEVVATRS